MNEDSSRESFWVRCGLSSGGSRRSELRLAGMTLVWAVLFAGGKQLITNDLLPAGPIPWAVAALPSVAAILVLVEFVRFLRGADELQRVIQLQALALGFGGGFFFICGYSLFEPLGAPPSQSADIVVIMPLLYVVGVLNGARRYR